MDPSTNKNTVMFVGYDEGKPTTYRIKVKTEMNAVDLKKALDREIEFVKAKASD